MISIKAFNILDINHFDPKDEFEDLIRDMKKAVIDTSKTMLTLWVEEDVLAIVGVSEHRQGAGELWLLPGKIVEDNKFAFFKNVKALIYEFVFPVLKFHRLEIAILAGWEAGYKWAKALGFKKSHVCEAYDSHYRDHVIFYRTKLWQ